ncbi:protein ALP1-like [Mizuhopecten yessoensis]|uniref:protein ALP1-like n=1 Tax=Mizuhopecten yessoensis TaxID=6573 RepID=UPI000B45A94D|nr:protein ALP1-like [Mizuhopecten yessoensis]
MADQEKHQYAVAALMHHNNLLQLALHQVKMSKAESKKKRKRRGRKWWVRPWLGRRPQVGVYDKLMAELRAEDQASFHNFLRMPREMFDELRQRVGPRITKKDTRFRPALDPGMKLALTLRHLASGDSYASQKFGWRVPHNTQSQVVREVCHAILDEYLDEMLTCPSTPEEWKEVADKFYQRWNFLQGFFSIVLLALVDSDYKFVWADLGGLGSASDAQIYNSSELKHGAEEDLLGFPQPTPLPQDTTDAPYFYIGDDAFALRSYMMKPYSLRGVSQEERIYNYRLSRARRVVENAFGILANRFQVILGTMPHKPETVKLRVNTCLVLHNLMRVRYPSLKNQQLDQQASPEEDFVPGAWRDDFNLEDTQVVAGTNTATKEAKKQRNLIKHWVNSSAGAVDWQDRMV